GPAKQNATTEFSCGWFDGNDSAGGWWAPPAGLPDTGVWVAHSRPRQIAGGSRGSGRARIRGVRDQFRESGTELYRPAAHAEGNREAPDRADRAAPGGGVFRSGAVRAGAGADRGGGGRCEGIGRHAPDAERQPASGGVGRMGREQAGAQVRATRWRGPGLPRVGGATLLAQPYPRARTRRGTSERSAGGGRPAGRLLRTGRREHFYAGVRWRARGAAKR